MKNLITLLLLFCSLTVQAQIVNFNLRPDGTFTASDGKDYVVVERPGKTAEELYSMVKNNILSLYNSPVNVMSENKPEKITIHALSNVIAESYKLGQGFVSYRAHYTYEFHFKDGRMKVDAPVINNNLDVTASGIAGNKTFYSLIDGWFDKKGVVKKKKKDEVFKVESILTLPINYLIGALKTEKEKQDDDNW